ncbi:MAG TPA: ABC transporter ATP-binding protein [Xanthobacteraceae bacterium]
MLLELRAVSKRFGGYLALDDVSCAVVPGSIHALIGPNGAGKTTLFNVICGAFLPTGGRLLFEGADYTGRRPDRVSAMGIARNFQQVRLFPGLSVVENIAIGRHCRSGGNAWPTLLRLGFFERGAERAARARAAQLFELVGIRTRADERPSELTLVDQRRLEIARALASEPRLLLLDEPAAGMNALEAAELEALIRRIRSGGVTVLIVEHNMRLVMSAAERVTVLSAGRVIADGSPAEVQGDAGVIAAYLGGAA